MKDQFVSIDRAREEKHKVQLLAIAGTIFFGTLLTFLIALAIADISDAEEVGQINLVTTTTVATRRKFDDDPLTVSNYRFSTENIDATFLDRTIESHSPLTSRHVRSARGGFFLFNDNDQGNNNKKSTSKTYFAVTMATLGVGILLLAVALIYAYYNFKKRAVVGKGRFFDGFFFGVTKKEATCLIIFVTVVGLLFITIGVTDASVRIFQSDAGTDTNKHPHWWKATRIAIIVSSCAIFLVGTVGYIVTHAIYLLHRQDDDQCDEEQDDILKVSSITTPSQ